MYSARLTPSMASALTNYALPWIHRRTWDQGLLAQGWGLTWVTGISPKGLHFTQGLYFTLGTAFPYAGGTTHAKHKSGGEGLLQLQPVKLHFGSAVKPERES